MAAISSLLKSAAGIRDQLATYQDSVEAYNYSNSAYTDSALSDYQKYLQSRIDALNAGGSISNASKALSLTKALDSATKSNISASIQRENIQMLSGHASLTDKYNVIVQQYSRAVGNGDMTLAQSLMSQAYSVNQSIQLQAQQSADAARTLANAAATAAKANAAAEGDIAGSLSSSLKQLNNDISNLGMGANNATVGKWVTQNKAVLESMGVKLPAQPNYFDIVTGIAGAQYNHNMLAAQMYAPYGTGPGSQSWNYAQKASDINSGLTKLPIAGGQNLTLQQVVQAASTPGEFVFNPSKGGFVQTQVTGHSFQTTGPDGKGPLAVQPTFSGTVAHTVVLQPGQVTQLQKLGLKFAGSVNKDGTVGDGIQVQATGSTPTWLKQVLGSNGVTNVYQGASYDAQGHKVDSLQFTFDAKNGSGQSIYTVIKDANGKLGLAEQSDTGDHLLSGEYGFNPLNIQSGSTSHEGIFGKLGGMLKAGFGDISNVLFARASADSILRNATGLYKAPIPIAQPSPLPSISLPPPPALPTISTRPTPAQAAPVVPRTVSIQGGSPQIQGGVGAGINQSGGKGVAITGTTNGPVGMRI